MAAVGSESKLVEFQLRGAGDEGNDAGAEPADRVVFYQQLGVAARPVVARSLRVLGAALGRYIVALKVWDKTKTPTDLAEGETRLHALDAIAVSISVLGARIDVRVGTGELRLASDSAGYHGWSVARQGDTVHAGTVTAIAGGYPVNFTYVPYPAGAPVISPTLVLSGGQITSGNAAIKG